MIGFELYLLGGLFTITVAQYFYTRYLKKKYKYVKSELSAARNSLIHMDKLLNKQKELDKNRAKRIGDEISEARHNDFNDFYPDGLRNNDENTSS